MRKLITTSLLLAALVAMFALAISAEEVKHEYVGEAKCKTCHKAEFTAWSETGHAKAFTVLSDEEKKKEECIACHTSGKMADGTLIEGVTCEGCHGPGADYKSMKIMSKKKWEADPEAHKKMAIEAGLIYPVEKDCVRCHTKEGNANFKEFDFAKRKGEVHPVKATEETKK